MQLLEFLHGDMVHAVEMRTMSSAATGSLLVALSIITAPAQAQAPAPAIPHERYQLPNGLDVILHQDRSIPIVHVNITYHVGSGNERPGQTGYAHLFEHLMFQGSKHVGLGKHDVVLRDIGARGDNGSTSTDRTNYYESVPSHQLETALWLESDRMGYLQLDQQAMDTQREVVRNERRVNYENVAYNQERFAVARALYPEGHPYRHLTIGLHEDLQRATLDDARTFLARWYVPANATLVLAGDFDIPTARALIDKWFGTFPPSSKPKHSAPPAPVLAAKVREQFTDPLATTARVRWVWPSPAIFEPGDAELDLIASLLSAETGRLRKLLFYDRALATSVGAFQTSRRFSGEFSIVADLRPGVNVADVESAMASALSTIIRGSIGERELKQAVAAREASSTRSLETLAGRAGRLQSYVQYGKDADSVAWELARYRKVTAADIKATVTRVLTDKRVEVVTLPMPGTRAARPLEAARPLDLDIRTPLPAPARARGGN
jgi:zinc protease